MLTLGACLSVHVRKVLKIYMLDAKCVYHFRIQTLSIITDGLHF